MMMWGVVGCSSWRSSLRSSLRRLGWGLFGVVVGSCGGRLGVGGLRLSLSLLGGCSLLWMGYWNYLAHKMQCTKTKNSKSSEIKVSDISQKYYSYSY